MKTKKTCALTAACLSVITLAAPAVLADQPDRHYTGTIASVDPQENTVSLKGVFSNKQFNVGTGCTYDLADQNAGALGDLRPGEKIRVSYQDNRGVLVADRIEQQPMRYDGMVKSIDPAGHTLTIHQRALDKDLQIAGDCKVVLRADKPGTLADIKSGDHVTVTYEDPKGLATARQIAQTSMEFTGSLVAIDLPERTVKAKESFSTKKFNLADNCVIVINGKTNGQLEDLKPEDRLVLDYDVINGVNVVNRIAPAEMTGNSVVTTAPGPVY